MFKLLNYGQKSIKFFLSYFLTFSRVQAHSPSFSFAFTYSLTIKLWTAGVGGQKKIGGMFATLKKIKILKRKIK